MSSQSDCENSSSYGIQFKTTKYLLSPSFIHIVFVELKLLIANSYGNINVLRCFTEAVKYLFLMYNF